MRAREPDAELPIAERARLVLKPMVLSPTLLHRVILGQIRDGRGVVSRTARVTTDPSARADRLREFASQAENLAALAGLADAQLTRAANDLATLAQAARRLATCLNCDADSAEVNAAIGGGQ